MILHRRSFITGLISLIAAPAIIRAGSLMPVKQMIIPPGEYTIVIDSLTEMGEMIRSTIIYNTTLPPVKWRLINKINPL